MDDIRINSGGSTQSSPNILMPLPDHGFDPTEAAIPWKICRDQGWKVTISTENGKVPQADQNKLNSPLPGFFSAGKKAREVYNQMISDSSFQNPIQYAEIDPNQFEALLLPGGEAPGMEQYFESVVLHGKTYEFCQHSALVGAICHGILILARAVDPQTGHSVLYEHKLTALPKSMDLFGYWIDKLLLKHGFILYPRCVADETRACLEHPEDFIRGPGLLAPFVVADGNLITSRWFMDADVFAARFVEELRHRMQPKSTPGSA